MKKLLTFAFALASLATLLPEAGATPLTPSAPVTQSGPTILPANVLEAPVVVVERRHHRHYRYVRRPYYYHGHRRYRSVRVYL